LVNWDKTYKIFNDKILQIIGEVSDNNYCDRDAESEIKKDDLDYVFNKIDNFKSKHFIEDIIENVNTFFGKNDISIKQWSNKNVRIQLLTTVRKLSESSIDSEDSSDSDESNNYVPYDNDYAIIYGDSSTFLILSNYGRHPSIYHPSFIFGNSDGSTYENAVFYYFNLDELKEYFKSKTLEYIFEQTH